MPLFTNTSRQAVLLAAAVLSGSATLLGRFGPASAAPVGSSQTVNFGQAVLASSCTLNATDGSLGVRTNRSLITSDSGEGGNFNGTLTAASISASSNLTSSAFVQVDSPLLSGGTGATSSNVRFGASGAWDTTAKVNLGADGELPGTPLHVRFSTTNNNNRFANGTYTASATVTCHDGAN